MTKKILKISGMRCASCAANIEYFLKKEEGIKTANVNFATEKLYLEFDEENLDIFRVKNIIEKLGYKVREEEEDLEIYKEDDFLKERNKKEIKRFKKKFISALFFSLPVIYLAMSEMLNLPLLSFFKKYNLFIQFIFSTIVIVFCFEIWKSGLKNLLFLMPNMDSLIFIGTAAAYFYSVTSSFLILFNGVENHFYYESTVLILVFIFLGKYLENITKGKTSEAIKKLVKLQAKEALIIKDGEEIKIPVSEVKIGDIVLVKPGEKIPVDGIVIDGHSFVDEKMITGESIPKEKKIGDEVIGGTINKSGILKFRAKRVGKETMLAQIIKVVEEAFNLKAPVQLLVDKVSFYFVPSVILIAIFSFIIWLLLGQSFSFALTVFMSVLIIACPCALGLATPTAVMMGISLAVKEGILIKTSKALEIAGKINVFVFDKTGTLTKGEPSVTNIIIVEDGMSEEDVLQIAGSLEKNSHHPLAEAIVNKAKEKSIRLLEITNFQNIAGKGVVGELNGEKIILGTRNLLIDNNINPEIVEEKIVSLEKQGKTVVLLAKNKKIIGIIAISDILKEFSKETINILHKSGKKVVMITGDNKRVAEIIARELKIDKVLAEVLPHEKSLEIKKLQEEGNLVAMVGDGINDAPALAQADLGIALGSSTDIAIETGEIILLKNDLEGVIKAIDLSNYTLKKIKQNLFWAFFYNIIGIPLAAGVFYPLTGWLLNPVIAAVAMVFSSVSVVFNSILMRNYKVKII